MRKITFFQILFYFVSIFAQSKTDTLVFNIDKLKKNIQVDGYLIEWSPKQAIYTDKYITQISLSTRSINGYIVIKGDQNACINSLTLHYGNNKKVFTPEKSKYVFSSVNSGKDIIYEWSTDFTYHKFDTIYLSLKYNTNNKKNNIIYKIIYTPKNNLFFYILALIIMIVMWIKFFVNKKVTIHK